MFEIYTGLFAGLMFIPMIILVWVMTIKILIELFKD